MQLLQVLNISHGLLVIQLFFPCDTILNPVAAAGASAQVLLLFVFVRVCSDHNMGLSLLPTVPQAAFTSLVQLCSSPQTGFSMSYRQVKAEWRQI